MITVLAVALEEEAEHLRPTADEVLLITGPGKVRSATALASHLAAAGPGSVDLVLNLGTAGALVGGLDGILQPRHLLEHDFDAGAVEALLGRPFPARAEIVHAPPGDLTLATGDRFLTDPVVVQHLRDRGVDLVDMEAAALHLACRHHGVAFRAVKCVSDMADHDAFRSWKASVADASRRLGDWLDANRADLRRHGA